MLNYIWIGLIVTGILTAAGTDIYDDVANTYRNGQQLDGTMNVAATAGALAGSNLEGELVISGETFNAFYGVVQKGPVQQPITITTSPSGEKAFELALNDAAPQLWKEMVKGALNRGKLSGKILSTQAYHDGQAVPVKIEFESIRFLKMKAVTQAAFDIASVAVTIALGLIGIMALWLGVMKVAEEAGLLKIVARLLSPLMKRLFPDVPSEHPAVGAMIMNIAANMLGLSNAATPMGLKAMEELNKLNPKPGTATNAMVTFLAINTGGLILIPATAIAVRASAGSVNPGIIIGTSIVGAGCATLAGILAAKLLQRLPRFKKELEAGNG